MIGWIWLERLIKVVETNSALQRRAFLRAERARSKTSARRASLVPLARPELRRRLMPPNRVDE